MLTEIGIDPRRRLLSPPCRSFPWTLRFTAWYWKWLSWVCFTNSEWGQQHGTGPLVSGLRTKPWSRRVGGRLPSGSKRIYSAAAYAGENGAQPHSVTAARPPPQCKPVGTSTPPLGCCACRAAVALGQQRTWVLPPASRPSAAACLTLTSTMPLPLPQCSRRSPAWETEITCFTRWVHGGYGARPAALRLPTAPPSSLAVDARRAPWSLPPPARCAPHTCLNACHHHQVVFYALTAILIAAFALCVLVGHSFKTGTFTWVCACAAACQQSTRAALPPLPPVCRMHALRATLLRRHAIHAVVCPSRKRSACPKTTHRSGPLRR